MTELGLLGFTATAMVTAFAVAAFVACDWHPGLGTLIGHQGIGIGLAVALPLLLGVWAIAWALADLWYPRLGARLQVWGQALRHDMYLRFYRARHAR